MTHQPPPQYGQQPVSGQPYSAPPPGWAGTQPAPRKKRKWPWIVGGLVLVSILGCGALALAGLLGTGAALNKLDENNSGKNAVVGEMGKASVDGKFQFTVTGMKCGIAVVGPADFGAKAQGQFCLVDVSVKNVGTTVEVFSDTSQKAYDAAGTEFTADSGAATWANKDHSTFLESINPGNQVKGKLVFDVPEGTKLTSIVLHESMFTAGVRVPLK